MEEIDSDITERSSPEQPALNQNSSRAYRAKILDSLLLHIRIPHLYAMAKSDKKADKKVADKAKAAKPAAASPAKTKPSASSKEILAKAKVLKASNGKSPVKRAKDESSDDSSASSSEDEQPQKTVLTSDSDDSPEDKKPASAPVSKKGKGKVESTDSSDSSSSDESSSDEAGDKDIEMQDVQPANGKKADKTKAAKPTASPAKKSNFQHHPRTSWLRLEHSKHRLQKLPNQAMSPQTPLRRMDNTKSLPLPQTPMTHRMMKSLPVS
ncbi:hypothetical protein EDB19DRAFT_822126 [Suillus lakei]|nr:hypothetical protein EDB19DRAFT_822126 [Suillus lakei]